MCPLRVLLIFLSATLAGFFVLRNLKAQSEDDDNNNSSNNNQEAEEKTSPKEQLPLCKKVGSAICTGFWTCVDMASGRYLWRNLVASSDKKRWLP